MYIYTTQVHSLYIGSVCVYIFLINAWLILKVADAF